MRVAAILNGHREGGLARASIGSYREAIDHARAAGIEVEPIVVLDRPDGATRQVFAPLEDWGARVIIVDFGDLGESRNRGVDAGSGAFVTFLDADDLWSFNWITESVAFLSRDNERTIGHSEISVVFGKEKSIWAHADQVTGPIDLGYLRIGNYWQALSFARRSVYLDVPFRKIDPERGFGYEDWDWNNRTLLAGYVHRPVPNTIHMTRKRQGSLLEVSRRLDLVPPPTALARYDTPLG